MADEKHLEILQMGKEAWSIWYNSRFRGPADLRGVSLPCADLAGLKLTAALMQGADLRYADLTGADLRGANLTDANIGRAILRHADLQMVRGLTTEQLYHAEGDQTTRLPEGMSPPAHWCPSNDELPLVQEPALAF